MALFDSPLRAIIWCAVSSKEQAKDDRASLHEQEREALELCAREGWTVVDKLIVPGHTRNYIDFYEMAADNKKAGIDAFYRLQEHWQRRDFDVLIVRDGDRLAREQAPVAFMIGFIIKAGARIFSMADGWIDERNHRTTGMFIGYRAASDVEQLKVKMRQGKDYKTLNGVYTGSRVPFGFMSVRSDRGRLIATVVDERYRRIYQDAAELLLTHLTWRVFEEQLYARYGHVDPRTHQPFKRMFFYHWYQTSWIWGHAARRHSDAGNRNGQKTGPWVWGDTRYPPPPDALIKYNSHTPIYSGELADRIKAELLRRRTFTGGARPNNSHRFTGLCLCGYCGYYMSYSLRNHSVDGYYRCRSRWTARSRPGCAVERSLRQDIIQAWVNDKLAEMLAEDRPDLLARDAELDDDTPTRLAGVRADVLDVTVQIAALIDKQSAAPASLRGDYDEKLRQLAERREILKARIGELEQQTNSVDVPALALVLAEIPAMGGLEAFWSQDDTAINAWLHRIMVHRRMVIRDNEVRGMGAAPPHPLYKHGGRIRRKNNPD